MASNEVVPSNNVVIDPLCTICHKLYNEPLLLSCLHSFCKKCLLKHIDKEGKADGGNIHIHCPTCEQRTVLPSSGEEVGTSLPINLRLSHLAEVTSYKKKMEGKVACDRCSNKAALCFCSNCCMFMCDTCTSDHQRWRELRTHEVIELESVKKKEGQSFKIQHPPQICQEHRKEEMRFYCLDDQILVCRDCLITTHDGHKRDYLEKVAKSEQEDLKQVLPDILGAIGELDKAIKEGKEMEKKVKSMSKAAITRIDKVCDELVQAVKARQEILHEKCKSITNGKEEVLCSQIDEFEKLKSVLTFLNEMVSDAINNHTPEELLMVKKVVKTQVTNVLDNFSRYLLALQENETMKTSLDVATITDAVASLGYFPGVPHPDNCTIGGLGVQEALVGKERVFKVILRDEKNQPLQGDVLFQYNLINKNDPDAPLAKVSITQSEDKASGCATLSITTPNAGEYQLVIKVRNTPLAFTDPFHMWAHPPRDYNAVQPDAPIVVLPVQSSASRGIAVDYATGRLYVSNFEKHIIQVLLPNGEVCAQIGNNENSGGNLTNPWGIAVTNDTLYVVSNDSHKVKMYALAGNFIGEFGENGNGPEQFANPRGIACDNNGHLLIADYGNARILVLTMEGKAVSSIPCGNVKPVGVCVGVDGSIHAALESGPILVYTNDDGKEWKQTSKYDAGRNPAGIAIDCEGYRMVTDSSDNTMKIVAPDNKIVKTCPNVCYGIARDSQGFIFAAHINKPEILKF